MEERILYIVRGVPGSGKSTFAKSLNPDAHYEADMYHTDKWGNYNWDPKKVRESHEWCRRMVKEAMADGKNRIAVSNTFTQEWEMDGYRNLAEWYGYKVFTIIVENRHGGKNVHNVPADTVHVMKERFEVKL